MTAAALSHRAPTPGCPGMRPLERDRSPRNSSARPPLPALALVLGALSSCGSAPASEPGTVVVDDPAEAQFVTTDIEHFWQAYDAGATAPAFASQYLGQASPGLADFAARRGLTGGSLEQAAAAFPRYLSAIRPNTLSLDVAGGPIDLIRSQYAGIKKDYPAAVFPPVTFLIGRFATGGTVGPGGILVGTEFFAADATTPLDELGAFQRDNVRPLSGLPIVVAHEHVHVLQARAGGILSRPRTTLLEQALVEGGADFVGALFSGGSLNQRLWTFAAPREAQIWAQFQAEMGRYDTSRWLYNQASATPDWPGDLGYFVGYRIVQAYYDRAADRRAALRDIIEVADAEAFLELSGYSPR
jgi:hypothetical protein